VSFVAAADPRLSVDLRFRGVATSSVAAAAPSSAFMKGFSGEEEKEGEASWRQAEENAFIAHLPVLDEDEVADSTEARVKRMRPR
jgi:hypothetical protein